MNDKEWEINMSELRQGKLQLAEHEENLLSQRALKDFCELKEYVSALESGYRTQGKMLRLYRAQTSRGDSLGRLMENQWSDEAALGYALIALNGIGLTRAEICAALEAMREAMRTVIRADAEERYRRW
jgi:hypothetical protein